uniref:transposase n=1 Tax=Streptomyces halobius TaxID=2879846 RepID=UPI0038737711
MRVRAPGTRRGRKHTTWRNGHPERRYPQVGDLDLKIPEVRTGSFFPSLLERRQRFNRALFAVAMERMCTRCPPTRWTPPTQMPIADGRDASRHNPWTGCELTCWPS